MKSSGIVRKVDELGRVVLPIELRRKIGVELKEPIEISVDGSFIVFKKYRPQCVFCKSTESVSGIDGKNICQSCLKEIKKL